MTFHLPLAGHQPDLGARPWWQGGTIYQIYPRSFQDSDGDGIGDLAGIAQRLDHVAALGVDAIWLSPIYPSPMADFGYDVSDYGDVNPMFGTLDDFDRLLAAAHARGLKLLLDFVPNHSSDQHPWFVESRSSRDNARRDWYIWRDPAAGGGPPLGAGSRQMYQSRLGLSRDERLSTNQRCLSELWLGTKSSSSFIPREWSAPSNRSKAARSPNIGSTSQ